MAALRAYETLDGDNPRAWVMTIARNKAIDHHRATGRRPIPKGDDLPEVQAPPPAGIRPGPLARGGFASRPPARGDRSPLCRRPSLSRDRPRHGHLGGGRAPERARGVEKAARASNKGGRPMKGAQDFEKELRQSRERSRGRLGGSCPSLRGGGRCERRRRGRIRKPRHAVRRDEDRVDRERHRLGRAAEPFPGRVRREACKRHLAAGGGGSRAASTRPGASSTSTSRALGVASTSTSIGPSCRAASTARFSTRRRSSATARS